MKTIALSICVLLFSITTSYGQVVKTTKSLFPIEKGSYWVYKGKIKWTPEGAGQKVKSRQLTWKMTVHDVTESAKYRVALVTGFPNDVAWYEEGMAPQHSLLVEDDKCVYWNGYENSDQAMSAAQAILSGTENYMRNLKCIIEFPLSKGKKYDTLDPSRPDTMYAWYVEAVDKVRLKIKGYRNQRSQTRYRLVYRTNTDYIIMEFVPALGITRYLYAHHGTVAFEDLRLVEYGKERS